jgi:hypothetical protein
MVADVNAAVTRAARFPERYAWVGSVYPTLESRPGMVGWVLTSTRRHVIFYRHDRDHSTVHVLAVRGAGQLPPVPDELAG